MRPEISVTGRLLAMVLLFVTLGLQAAPVEYRLKDLDGRQRALSEFRGKWVVVNFWATWCPPCRAEIPDLELFHNAHKEKDAVVVGISMGGSSVRQVRDFAGEMSISYPLLIGDPSGVTPLGTVTGLPTTFLVSPQGEVIARQVGPVTREALEQFLERQKRADGGRLKEG